MTVLSSVPPTDSPTMPLRQWPRIRARAITHCFYMVSPVWARPICSIPSTTPFVRTIRIIRSSTSRVTSSPTSCLKPSGCAAQTPFARSTETRICCWWMTFNLSPARNRPKRSFLTPSTTCMRPKSRLFSPPTVPHLICSGWKTACAPDLSGV